MTNTQDMSQDVRLLAAIAEDDVDALNKAIASGANVHAEDCDGDSAVVLAVFYNHPRCLKVLISAGANLNERIGNGNTTVLMASAHNSDINSDHDCLILLADAGADIECLRVDYPTEYMIAKSVVERKHLNGKLSSAASDVIDSGLGL